MASALIWAIPTSHADPKLAWRGVAVALLIQALLIARSGQSLGKIVTGLRIVRRDGRKVGVFQGFVLRELPFRALTFLTALCLTLDLPAPVQIALLGVCLLVNLLDDAWILGAERRCLHDRLAGTWVVSTAGVATRETR
ncbi:Hypothetical protein A7982_06889 [Minicystis rosea]|nr:Hypothetical protein A7982_06889 [Minicystis rosea]